MTQLRPQYPEIEPFKTEKVPVSELHTVFVSQYGNPKGIPAVALHGGPSTPYGELTDNNTASLISDIELLRERYGFKKWHVYGNSWGSTLSLAYAQKHPEHVASLIVSGIWLMRPVEYECTYEGVGVGYVQPEALAQYKEFIPKEEQGSLIMAYYKRVFGDDPVQAHLAADHWVAYETATGTISPPAPGPLPDDGAFKRLAYVRILLHFMVNSHFSDEDAPLNNIDKIRHIPGAIIQGRYDTMCPVFTAYALHKAWPEAKFTVVPMAGHSALEAPNASQIVRQSDMNADLSDQHGWTY
ncbi:proline iminopeptidase [Pseudohyphozyma bogoriensis]|nr:proline iminopeptidase [Pseudohyphozyma bogoriensis]